MYVTEDDLLPFVKSGELRHQNPNTPLGKLEGRSTYATGEALARLKELGFETFPSPLVPKGAELIKDGEFTRILEGPDATRLHGQINAQYLNEANAAATR